MPSFDIRHSIFNIRYSLFNTYMKLRQNGIVSLTIRPAVFLAGGRAYMKLHKIRYRFKNYLTAELAEYAEII